MAAAVQVFRENGQERAKLEEAASHFQADLTAKLEEAENLAQAAGIDQMAVVKNMKLGLMKLAEGDLMFRLTDWFPVEYKGLRMDFNQSMGTLQETMVSIARNASGIYAGCTEITQASDDLSRRTEQQAATLEQTAAALDENYRNGAHDRGGSCSSRRDREDSHERCASVRRNCNRNYPGDDGG